MHTKVGRSLSDSVGSITGFQKGSFLFTYLGYPMFYTRRKKDYYNDLTMLDPPNNVLEHLHKMFARFFWSTNEESRSRHLTKWLNLCLPKKESRLGFRSLFDVSKSLFPKLWWNFKTTKSLWSNFMWNKYCKKEIPALVQFKDGSHVWRKMLKAREVIEHEILWQMHRGSTNVWHKNWTSIRALYHVVPPDFNINEELHDVAQLRTESRWDDQLLHHTFPGEIADHINNEIFFDNIDADAKWDTPKWMPTTSGKYTVSSAWDIVRHREPTNHEQKNIWTKCLPFKISFFLWRGKIPTDDLWRKMVIKLLQNVGATFPHRKKL
ncbi:uncharacterized protein [Nicotiana tomentosiformis]|uniref:uncharacterized protein n=1 Tax=Nicotiana tomentosiformis TaxID=4098 RepID=UPI00388C7D00